MDAKKKFDKKWLVLFYDRVTDQFSLSRQSLHNTHQWMITLVFGLITALFALFQSSDGYPSEYGFITLLITFPLLLRFFIRSCLEYSIQRKWQTIRNQLDIYFLDNNSKNEKRLRKTIEIYYFKWKSPISIWEIIWTNMKLAYLWPLIVYFGLIGWGAYNLPKTPLIMVISGFVMIFVLLETFYFFRYPGFQYVKLENED